MVFIVWRGHFLALLQSTLYNLSCKIRKTNQLISLLNTFIFVYLCIFQIPLVKYLYVPFYKGSFCFSFWQMKNEMAVRFYRYCVSQIPCNKTRVSALLLICARHKSIYPLHYFHTNLRILFPQQGCPLMLPMNKVACDVI